MTDLINIAKECGAVFEGPCNACVGSGVVMETITVPVCCGRFSPHGDCCGNPDPAQECQPSQCGCGGVTFLHLSTDQLHATVEKVCGPLVRQIIDLVGEATSAGWLGEIDDMAYQSLEEDKYRSLNRTITKAIREGVNCLEDHRKLMGQDK